MKLAPIPPYMLNTPVTIAIETGQTSTGEALETVTWTGKCWLVDKTEQRLDAERRLASLSGHIYVGQDPAPGVELEGGTVTIRGKSWKAFKAERKWNPDGSIHHTKIYLR